MLPCIRGLISNDTPISDSSASIHVMSASFGGCTQFDAAQRNSCDCVKKGKAEKRRHQSLNDFYKKHNKDKLGDVDKLWFVSSMTFGN